MGRQSRDPTPAIVAALVAVIPCAIVLAPVLISTGHVPPLMFWGTAILTVLMFGIFVPYIDLLSGNHEALLAAVLAVAGVSLFAIGIRESRFSDMQPRPDSIFYILDANSGHATWASLDRPEPCSRRIARAPDSRERIAGARFRRSRAQALRRCGTLLPAQCRRDDRG
jgi:hypothetical protein